MCLKHYYLHLIHLHKTSECFLVLDNTGCQRCYPEEYQLQINYENEDDYDHYDEFPM